VYYKDVFEKYADTFDALGVDENNGVGDVYAKIQSLPEAERAAIEADLNAVYESRPGYGHGGFRSRHHQPARTQRHYH
jgi:isocitrate dehydrogenase